MTHRGTTKAKRGIFIPNRFQDLDTSPADIDLPKWSKMALSMPALQALNSLGFSSPTSIQSLAIPRIKTDIGFLGYVSEAVTTEAKRKQTFDGNILSKDDALGVSLLKLVTIRISAAQAQILRTTSSLRRRKSRHCSHHPSH
jgi:hypothetical protein